MASSFNLILSGLLFWGGADAQTGNVPQVDISNGLVKALIYLPDAERGYYRGMRFDWAGVVASLTYENHSFFGAWFPKYDPLLHDAISGPVEEFRSGDGALGYAETKVNGLFMKIGVGVLRKLEDEPYNFARSYTLVNAGRRVVRPGKDRVVFIHELSDGEGYAYIYTKTLRLPGKKAQLVLEHELKNTGKRAIVTNVYNHDFYMLDQQPTGPDTRVKFTFAPKHDSELTTPARLEGNELRFDRELAAGGESAHGALTGFSSSIEDNDVRVENVKTKVGVRERSDQPISRLYFWSVRTTVCPEVYIHIQVEPGHTFKWRTSYDFYALN